MSIKLQRLRAEIPIAHDVDERGDLHSRFAGLCATVDDLLEASATPPRVRAKAEAFADLLTTSLDRLGPAFWQPSYLLNVVADAMVRTAWISREATEFLHIGLYFHGLRVIERRFAAHSTTYLAVHADLLGSFVSRAGLKDMIERGAQKIAEGRIFCLTYDYLNELRKAWHHSQRSSADALDHALPGVNPDYVVVDTDLKLHASDRVGIMMAIFAKRLTAMQQRVYLAKNRTGEASASMLLTGRRSDDALVGMLNELNRELDGHGNLGWSELAVLLKKNEKTLKREYLKALHTLLSESARLMLGSRGGNAFVTRVLAQLNEVVEEKDLRMRSNTGEGMGRLVEKWEVALRMVLNQSRVPA